MTATAELVTTNRRIVETLRAEWRMLVVPLMAGTMISFSGSSFTFLTVSNFYSCM